MEWFNNFLLNVVPLAPKWAVRLVAKKYFAGETLESAAQEIQSLNQKGFYSTADILGENVEDIEEVQQPVESYLELMEKISDENLNSGISLKLTQLGLKIDKEQAWKNFEKLLEKAEEQNIFVRIDMEDSSCTDDTLEFYQ